MNCKSESLKNVAIATAMWLSISPVALAADTASAPAKSTEASRVEKSETHKRGQKTAQDEQLKEVKSDAVSEVDGVNLDVDEEKKGFTIGDLNPLKWIFKPVTDTQKEVRRLGKRITHIETPITDLQKPMVGLRQDMVNVHGQMGEIHQDISGVQQQTSNVDKTLGKVEHNLNRIYEPVVKLKEPVEAMAGPVNNVRGNLQTLKSDMKGLKEVVGVTSTAILIAVIGAGLLVVIGTPIAALLVWRNRSKILKMMGSSQREIKAMQHDTQKVEEKAHESSVTSH